MAFILATPPAWYATQWWLQQYSYKVDVGAAICIIAGLGAFLIAAFTMTFQSIKAAVANPVDSLRKD